MADGAAVATVARSEMEGNHLSADLSCVAGLDRARRWLDDVVEAADHDDIWLFHLAGTLEPIGFAGEIDTDRYVDLVLLDSASPQIVGHSFLASMNRWDRSGGLVLATSGAATTVYPGWSGYCAAKAATDQWVRVVGAEQRLRGSPVKVLAATPGVVETGMQEMIRSTDARDFPDVGRFKARSQAGDVRSARWAALAFWSLLQADRLESGSIVDLWRTVV